MVVEGCAEGGWFKGEYEGSSREFRCKEGKVWRVSVEV